MEIEINKEGSESYLKKRDNVGMEEVLVVCLVVRTWKGWKRLM